MVRPVNLTRYAWLSIATAIATISLKGVAYLITGSVGLLSDAAESVVNLVAAIVVLIALKVAVRPADASHHYGHGKAEYFSAGLEGVMIFAAAAFILVSAVNRFLHPVALDSLGVGLVVSTVGTALNGAVGFLLIRVGRRHRSATLVADGKHLIVDVWTSAGVILGVLLVAVVGWDRLDPIVAAVVGVNILVAGTRMTAQSVRALLGQSMSPAEQGTIVATLDRFRTDEVDFHGLQTRQAGRHGFVDLHMLVPGDWSVRHGHDLSENVEAAIREALPDTTVMIHIEPSDDPRSYEDYAYDGHADSPGATGK